MTPGPCPLQVSRQPEQRNEQLERDEQLLSHLAHERKWQRLGGGTRQPWPWPLAFGTPAANAKVTPRWSASAATTPCSAGALLSLMPDTNPSAGAPLLPRCPGCHVWVERTAGCDTVHCWCGQVFCYRCGRPLSEHDGLRCRRPPQHPERVVVDDIHHTMFGVCIVAWCTVLLLARTRWYLLRG